ncbi:MAG TPA: GMC family oxidoreductase [Steroidobacteraceae bacterium]|nr:GMC family oxidoreductase [Steroidobacteraceae bacterium]
MAQRLPEVDVVVIGVGMVGSIVAKELAASGYRVVGLERGEARFTVPEFQSPAIHDELRFSVRKALMQDNTREPVTFRNRGAETALPIRRWESFLPGTGLGGSMVHWNGQTYRFQANDFELATRTRERYGKDFLDPDLTIQDWGVSYAELEPHYDRFEYLLGTSGKAGNIKGKIQPGGDPLESPRSRDYPTPPMKEHFQGAMFRKAAASLGHHPFPQPSSNLSRPYTNPEGVKLNSCVFCGFCERYACEHYAKAAPQTIILPVLLASPNFELRTGCQVQRVNLDSSKTKATGVTYFDAAGREFEQPASLVIVAAFALNNVRMLLLSGIGKPYDPASGSGVVGRNYAYQTVSSVASFFGEDVIINPFMASGASGTLINDFAGDNFDHSALGFIGGAYIGAVNTNGRPIQYHPVPPGTPAWGKGWKEAVLRHYNHTVMLVLHGSSVSQRQNYLDLDPTYRDAWGQPLLRMTFDFPENDLKMARYVTAKGVEIGKAMGAKQVVGSPRKAPYTTQQYQTTHNTGGAVMGDDPSSSVVNRYLQCWDVPNVFVIGASAYPQNATWNPTGTLGALTYWAIDAMKRKYLKAPGPLVSA